MTSHSISTICCYESKISSYLLKVYNAKSIFSQYRTCEDGGLVGFLVLSRRKRLLAATFPSSSSRTVTCSLPRLPSGLRGAGFRSGCAGSRQHVAPLPLQPLHGAAQVLDAAGLGSELLVETLKSGTKGLLCPPLLATPRAGVRLGSRWSDKQQDKRWMMRI